MPGRRHSLLLLIALPACVHALAIRATTGEDMSVTGRVTRIFSSILEMETLANGRKTQVGIPLESLNSVQLIRESDAENGSLLNRLESCVELLPLLDEPSRGMLLMELHALAANADWQAVYLHASRLAKVASGSDFQTQCFLLKAWALYELGLHQQALQETRILVASTDALDAPPRLCWLMARLASEPAEVRFWSLLPTLQIPSQPTLE